MAVNFNNNKLISEKKRTLLVVDFILFYNSKKNLFCRDFGISKAMLEAWISDKGLEAEEYIRSLKNNIREELRKEMGISQEQLDEATAPTVENIKKTILARLYEQASKEIDPSKLANAYRIIHQYAEEDERQKKSKKKSIYDELKDGGGL